MGGKPRGVWGPTVQSADRGQTLGLGPGPPGWALRPRASPCRVTVRAEGGLKPRGSLLELVFLALSLSWRQRLC